MGHSADKTIEMSPDKCGNTMLTGKQLHNNRNNFYSLLRAFGKINQNIIAVKVMMMTKMRMRRMMMMMMMMMMMGS